MKNYKMLVPIVLVVLFFASFYMLYDAKATELQEYNSLLETARDYRLKDIRVDAEQAYLEALEMRDSLELSLEIGEFYRETEQILKALEWGDSITNKYPREAAGYVYLMGLYDQRQDYVECFRLADTFTKRELQSPEMDAILDRIEYTYYFNGGHEDATIFSGTRCAVFKEGKWGYVSNTGGKVVLYQYTYAGPFGSGLAPVTDADGACYFIDTEGNKKHVVLGVDKIERLGFMENGVFSLYDGKSWSFYNLDHEMLFGGYEDVSALGNGIVAVKQGDSWSLLDSTGADLTGKTYQTVVMDDKGVVYRNERLFVSDGDGFRMINSAGEVIGTGKYEDARLFNDATYAAVKINGKWGFIDKDGNVVIEPAYEDARSFANGLAAVMQDGLWGYIEPDGEVAMRPQFYGAKDFNSNGCTFVLNEHEWTLLRLYKYNH